ncbi:MAG: hypothetical protein ABR999_01215 [Methanoregula sp.]|jgi:hypothetical protein|uniref:hypothetical protein n=1 Tax=Methanoregula sp. TaxID=2052170 RepID=UPI003D0B9B5B
MIEKCYSIHDIVKFKIISKNIGRRINVEYDNFEVEGIDNIDFVVYLGDFTPHNENCHFIDQTYYLKENYFYCKDSYKFGKWKVQVSGLDAAETRINLSTNFIGTLAADMFICAFVIDFFIRFKLERKGYSVIHASSMSKDNHAFMFPSQSGAGKTTTAIYLADKGYDYLGDDFIILRKGQIFSYPTALNIFTYNLNPVIKRNLSRMERTLLKIKNAIYIVTAGKIKIFTKMNPKHIPGLKVIDKSNLKAVYLLAQGDKFETNEAKIELIVSSILINQKLESFPFLKYLLEYSYVFPNSSIAQFWKVCERNLKENLKCDVKFYYTRLPQNYNGEVFYKFREAMECGN